MSPIDPTYDQPTRKGAIGFLNDQILVRDEHGQLSTDESFVSFLLAFRRHYDRVVLYSRVAPEVVIGGAAVPVGGSGIEVVELPFYPRIANLFSSPQKWWPAIDAVLKGPKGLATLDALWLNTGHPVSMRALSLVGKSERPQLVAALRGNYETDAALRDGSGGLGGRVASLVQTATLRGFARQARRRGVPVLAYGGVAVSRATALGMTAHNFETTLVLEADLNSPPDADPTLAADLLVVCRLVREKGLDRLLAGLPNITNGAGEPATLAIVGDGVLREELQAQVQRLGLADRVRFDGYVAHGPALLKRLRSAKVFALPSRTEGQPASVIEAMSMRVPVVAAAVGGVPELCGDGRGLIVDAADEGFVDRFAKACTTLLQDVELQNSLSERGFARVSEVTLERQVDRAVAILRGEH